jgi:tRNA nucleotidyltransferase (CCA-adding enzyme)
MKIYLVGGAVRDQLLNLPVKERDWVVVGATTTELLNLGYRQVGKDFPVFLHPETHEEYALARLERKVGKGYTGFSFDASPNVTLEEDLKRRDITINAIAQTLTGDLIDPYHGQADLKNKILRHVSAAFVEDPVRILRIARFAARFAALNFQVAPETLELMKSMVQSGEIDALVAERVWKELERALSEKNPEKFFAVLQDCGALSVLFPTLSTFEELKRASQITNDVKVRFAVMLHANSDAQIQALSDRYRIPNEFRELALLVARHLALYQKAKTLTADEILQGLQATDAFRREERFKNFLLACEVVSASSHSEFLWSCYLAAKSVSAQDFLQLSGKEIAEKMAEKRRENIATVITS